MPNPLTPLSEWWIHRSDCLSGLHFLSLRNSPGITLTAYKVAGSEFKPRSLVQSSPPAQVPSVDQVMLI